MALSKDEKTKPVPLVRFNTDRRPRLFAGPAQSYESLNLLKSIMGNDVDAFMNTEGKAIAWICMHFIRSLNGKLA